MCGLRRSLALPNTPKCAPPLLPFSSKPPASVRWARCPRARAPIAWCSLTLDCARRALHKCAMFFACGSETANIRCARKAHAVVAVSSLNIRLPYVASVWRHAVTRSSGANPKYICSWMRFAHGTEICTHLRSRIKLASVTEECPHGAMLSSLGVRRQTEGNSWRELNLREPPREDPGREPIELKLLSSTAHVP